MIPQESFVFDATIEDNVRYGRPEATTDEVRAAFEELGLGDWLASLPEGVATRVGELGSSISVGERQLVSLARAWLAAPDLLLRDEATSSVDPATAGQVQRALTALAAGRTTVLIAHRMSTSEAADEIIVFEGGRIVERGSHGELVAAGGAYARLHADWVSAGLPA